MQNKRRFKLRILACGILTGCMAVALVHADDNNGPGAGQQGVGQQGGGGGGGGGQGRQPQSGFHLIPRFAEQKLDLTDDQKKQIADLEKETKEKLAKILTADQMKTLLEARPPRPGQGGQGGGGQGNRGGGGGGGGNGGGGGGGDQGGPPPGN